MDEHLKTGALGEELACRSLEAKGYSILERNWRSGHRELDLIAQRGGTLAIVEVKTRSAGSLLRARDSVSQHKQSLLIQAADHYVRTRGLELDVRYDIIAIDIASDQSYTLEHIEAAFYPRLGSHRRSRRSATKPHK